jgi:fumarate hydratase, class II
MAALKQAALAKGVPEDLFDRVVDPLALTRAGTADVPSSRIRSGRGGGGGGGP